MCIRDSVKGVGDGRYLPEDPVTREQMAAIFHRYAGYKDYDGTAQGDLSAFTDAASVGDWAREALIWAVDKGLINGMGEDVYKRQPLFSSPMPSAYRRKGC